MGVTSVIIRLSMTTSEAVMKKFTQRLIHCLPTESLRANERRKSAGFGAHCHDLASLLGQCDFNAPQPKDVQVWERMHPVGLEF